MYRVEIDFPTRPEANAALWDVLESPDLRNAVVQPSAKTFGAWTLLIMLGPSCSQPAPSARALATPSVN